MTNCRREQEGSRQKSTQVESVTEGRHRKRFVAHRGRRDSVQGAEGESHFRRLRNSNKSRAFALFFFGWTILLWRNFLFASPRLESQSGAFSLNAASEAVTVHANTGLAFGDRRLLTNFSFAIRTRSYGVLSLV